MVTQFLVFNVLHRKYFGIEALAHVLGVADLARPVRLQNVELAQSTIAHIFVLLELELKFFVVVFLIEQLSLDLSLVAVVAVLALDRPLVLVDLAVHAAKLVVREDLLSIDAVQLGHHQIQTTLQLLIIVLKLVHVLVLRRNL